ncbi:glutamate N-acetyltransferase, putative [Babesia ovata]|uniref:Glutamate N-acetyltransferase, putative n=1 Tax=Babesia ovata TaxID=189622 RepID=A0A2H6K7E8_9APIC|nr:glutamate N-acetyltransferase, putative [Babesia ovata]GBE58898.1 glutamate N-acetyltransferase, putative [Babesia ovata]
MAGVRRTAVAAMEGSRRRMHLTGRSTWNVGDLKLSHVPIATFKGLRPAFLGSASKHRIKPTVPRYYTGWQPRDRLVVDQDRFANGAYRDVSCNLAAIDKIVALGRNIGALINRTVHPQIVSDEYYRYAHWRMLERFAIAAAMALASQTQPMVSPTGDAATTKGVSKDGEAGQRCSDRWISWMTRGKVSSALTSIVLKDIVSRAFNFVWFGKIGAGFDDNPKAFRLLGGLLCSVAGVACFVGNVLKFEPKVLLNVSINVLKHVGMLTMLAAQAAFHTTFCVKNAATNVGEITAKLEAQSPICDFIGMATGMQLGTLLADKPFAVQTGVFSGFCVVSGISTYMCAKSVCFRTLNPQRCFVLLEDFASVLLRRLDRYLRYHKMRLEALRHRYSGDQGGDSDDGEDSDSDDSSSNSCFEDDECGAIAEMIHDYEFDTASRLLNRFTSKHLCNKLKRAREADKAGEDSNVRYPNEPLNLVQKRIGMKFLTPEQVAAREPLLFPWRDGALKHGAVKYSLADMSVCPATLAEYLKIFKGERFVVALGSDGIVECAIHRSAKPRDAMLAILTYNIAEKLWTLLDESMEPGFIDHQLEQIWDLCKRSAVSLKEVLVRLNAQVNTHHPNVSRATDGEQLREEMQLWKWGLQTVRYAYNMAQACIDEVMLSAQAAKWDVEKFDLCSPFKH